MDLINCGYGHMHTSHILVIEVNIHELHPIYDAFEEVLLTNNFSGMKCAAEKGT